MANGIFDYARYLNTLQTVTEVGNIFPSEQKKWTYSIEGGGTQGWTAEINWLTLIVETVSFDATGRPDFSNSNIFGYYEGGTATEYSNGTISIPAGMYTGPILPATTRHIPVTVVNIRWTKDGATFANNIALVQNWEPGVDIEDPVNGNNFIPIVKEPSTLTLTGPGAVIYGRTLTMSVTTDIPIFLGNNSVAYFFWDRPAGRVLLGSAIFSADTRTAIFNYNTNGTSLVGGATYPIYAEFSGVRQYGWQRSNTVQQVITAQIPLVLVGQSFSPSQAEYLVGDTPIYTLRVRPDPSYPQTGVAVGNTLRFTKRNAGPITTPYWTLTTPLSTTTFVNGIGTVSVPVTLSDFNLSDYAVNDSAAITTGTIISNVYNFTLKLSNIYAVDASWDVFFDGPYAAGQRNLGNTYQVAHSVTGTIVGEAFPISISKTTTSTYLTEPLTVTVTKPVRNYAGSIRLFAVSSTGTTSTVATFPFNAGTNRVSATFDSLGLGTWTLYAEYTGDLGTGYQSFRKNLPSTSNAISHFVRLGNDLNPIFTFDETATNDILRMRANFANQLPKWVDFYEGSTFITSSTWTRNTTTTIVYTTSTVDPAGTKTISNLSTERGWPTAGKIGTVSNPNPTFYNLGGLYQNKWPIYSTLYRYKSSSESNSSYIANPIEPYNPVSQQVTITGPYGNTYNWPYVTIGDGKGYNVIGLTEQLANYFPRNYTIGAVTLTLVQYIGNYDGRHLYRFTPEIIAEDIKYYDVYDGLSGSSLARWGTGAPGVRRDVRQGGQYFQPYTFWIDATNAPAGTNYMDLTNGDIYIKENERTVRFPVQGGYASQTYARGWYLRASGGESGFWQAYVKYINFGNRSWVNPNPSDSRLAARYNLANAWYDAVKNIRTGNISSATVTTISEDSIYRDTNSIRIELPKNTISNAYALRAVWPGTLDLDRTYGKFNPFDISIQLPPAEINLLPAQYSIVDASATANPSPTTGGTWTNAVYGMFATNGVRLGAQVSVDPEFGTGITGGTATFFNSITGDVFGSAPVVNDRAYLTVSTSTLLSSTTGTATINYGVRFQGQFAGTATSTTTNSLQVTNNSAFTMVDFNYTGSSPFSYVDTGASPVPPRAYDRFSSPIMASITRHPFMTITKSDYPQFSGTGNPVYVDGYVDMLLPQCEWRGAYSPYQASSTYPSNRTSTFHFLTYATINYADGTSRRVLLNRNATRIYMPSPFFYFYDNQDTTITIPSSNLPTMRSLELGNHASNTAAPKTAFQLDFAGYWSVGIPIYRVLFWNDPWTSIVLDMDVAAWEFNANNNDNGLASLGANARLGYNTRLTVSN